MSKGIRIEVAVLFYFLAYVPNILLTKYATSFVHPALGRPLTGLETLPPTLIMNLVLTYAFIWYSGWFRFSNQKQIGRWKIPVPTKYTFISGIGTACILFTVPLSYTFQNVSIPFIQLLMRGDILIIAPLVDFIYGRRVRWWSWTALGLVAISLFLVMFERGGLKLPPLAIAAVVIYTAGYFTRLWVMTRVSKDGNTDTVKRYFVEEKVVALPMSIVILALLSLSGFGSQAGQLEFGFLRVWTDPVMWPLIGMAISLTIVSVFAAIILLDSRENTYCVPLERSSSLLAGLSAAFILHWTIGLPKPTGTEVLGAVILIGSIALLWLAPRWEAKRSHVQSLETQRL